MTPDNLNEFIKKQVEHHETPTDPDLLWQKIEAKQKGEKKRKRRFFFLWFFGGAFFLGSLAMVYFTQISSADDYEQGEKVVVDKALDGSDLIDIGISETTVELDGASGIEKVVESSQETISQSGLSAGIEELKTAPINGAEIKSIKSKSLASLEGAHYSINKEQKNNGNNSKEINNTSENTSFFYKAESAGGKKSDIIMQENERREKGDVIKYNQDLIELIPVVELIPVSNAEKKLIELKIDDTSISEEGEKGNSTQGEGGKNEKQWNISNGLAFTYGKPLRDLSAKSPLLSDYLQLREDMETPLDMVSVNLDFMAQHQSGFYLKAGLEFQQINERLDFYTEWDSTEIMPDQVLAIYYAKDGTVSETIGEGETTTTYFIDKKAYNHYRSFDIPVLVGYDSRKDDKRIGWFIEAGAAFNLRFTATGDIVGPGGALWPLKGNSVLFRNKTGVSLIGAAGLTYKVADKLSIWASPDIRYDLSSVTSDANLLEQKYTNVGMRLGIRYHWSKS